MIDGTLLFYCGLALMIVAAAAAILTALILWISGRRIRTRLRDEYGEKRH